MNRLKFVVYWIVVLTAFAFALRATPSLMPNVDESVRPLQGLVSTISANVEAEKGRLDSAAAQLGSSGALLNALPKSADGKWQAMTAERFNQIRGEFVLGIPEAARSSAVVAVVANIDGGTIVAKGEAAPEAATEADLADLGPIASNASSASMASLSGRAYAFRTRPLLGVEKGEVKAVGSLIVGIPAFAGASATAVSAQQQAQATSVSILTAGAAVATAGDKATAERAAKELKSKSAGVWTNGSVASFGPLSLPLWVEASPNTVAVRQDVPGTPYELIATGSVTAAVERVVGLQRTLLFGLLLSLLGGALLLWLLNNGTPEPEPKNYSLVPPPAFPTTNAVPQTPVIAAPAVSAPAPAPAASWPTSPAHAEAMASGINLMAPFESPIPQPASLVPPDEEAAALATAGPFDSDGDSQPTVAYPAYKPVDTPMVPGANVQGSHEAQQAGGVFGSAVEAADATALLGGEPADNPDTTRVAPVPAELMRAAREASEAHGDASNGFPNVGPSGFAARPSFPPFSTTSSSAKMPTATASGSFNEEVHFEETYREFITTRERCGEPADGLTYERFRQKLVKSKEQLVAKHNAKGARFHVYVKDGKAALKASPIK